MISYTCRTIDLRMPLQKIVLFSAEDPGDKGELPKVNMDDCENGYKIFVSIMDKLVHRELGFMNVTLCCWHNL